MTLKDQQGTAGPPFSSSGDASTVEVEFKDYGDFIAEYAPNLSSEGMFLRTPKLEPVGSVVEFTFRLEDDVTLVQGRGQVVWVRPPERPPAGMGIRFLDLDPLSRELIGRIVDRNRQQRLRLFDLIVGPDGVEVARQIAPAAPGPARPAVGDEPEIPEEEVAPEIFVPPEPEEESWIAEPLPEDERPRLTFSPMLAALVVAAALFGFVANFFVGRVAGWVAGPAEQAATATRPRPLRRSAEIAEPAEEDGGTRATEGMPSPSGEADAPPEDLGDEGSPPTRPLPSQLASPAEAERGAADTAGPEPAPGAPRPAPSIEPVGAEPTSPPELPPVSSGRFTQLQRVTWREAEQGTVVTLWGDGPLLDDNVSGYDLDRSRALVVVRGAGAPFAQTVVPVGTRELVRIRSGFHPKPGGNELHIVLDLGSQAVRLLRLEVVGSQVDVYLGPRS